MFNLIKDKLNKNLTTNIDLHGRRIINAGNSINLSDYVTKKDLNEAAATAIVEASSFSDDFSTDSFAIPTKYIYQTARNGSADSYFGGSIGTGIFNITHYGTANINGNNAFFLPRSLINSSKIYGKDQFAEIRFISMNAAASISGGIGVFTRGDNDQFKSYVLEFESFTNRLRVMSWINTTATVFSLNPTTFAANDLFRLNVVKGIGKNTITLKKNNVQVFQGDDAAADRPGQDEGIPSIYVGSNFTVGGAMSFDDFSCGLI